MKQHMRFIATLGVCFLALNTTTYAQQVKVDTGGIGIVGPVTSSTIITGVPLEKVDELVRDAKRPLEELTTQQRENIALLKEKLDLNERQVRAALGILGENDIPPERLTIKLIEIAERFKTLQTTALAQSGDSQKVTALKAEAQKAIEEGELAKADALLADVETEQRHALDRLAGNAAETLVKRSEIAFTRLRYAEAAKHLANAAAVFPPNGTHEEIRIGFLQMEALALYWQGDEFGDNESLRAAIDRYMRLLDLNTRERAPLEWALIQDLLGVALRTLGGRESGTEKLGEAAIAFREALKERTHERTPLDWATTQNDLAGALFLLGTRESGTEKLEEAIDAYHEALKEHIRERNPDDWATTQSNLANVLSVLGWRESGTAKLEQAVAAYREALKEKSRERDPLDWALTQNNLGNALFRLGGRESGTEKLEEAVAAFREVLKVRTRERVPLQWATTQSNLGDALGNLGERERGTDKLAEAVAAYREALKERTRERVPLDWALTQYKLGLALRTLGGGAAKDVDAVRRV
jgi:tetratricopeptide (TPR) repeat protein